MELRLVSHAEHSPGTCFRCTSHKGPFVDTGITHFDGQVYICKDCVAGIARTMGLPSAEQLAGVEAELSDAREQIDELKAEMAEARRRFVSRISEMLIEDEREPAEVAS